MSKDKPLAKGEPRSTKGTDANRDPITGAPGAHPVGTGLGAAAGGLAAGAAVGTVAGPIGTAVGAAVGAIAGGLAGKGIAERIDPTAEDAYWRENFSDRPYVNKGSLYDDYQPAYRYGVDSYNTRYAVGSGLGFDEVEPELATGWDKARGQARRPRLVAARERRDRARRAGRLGPRRQVSPWARAAASCRGATLRAALRRPPCHSPSTSSASSSSSQVWPGAW
jgi:hypothetical protein